MKYDITIMILGVLLGICIGLVSYCILTNQKPKNIKECKTQNILVEYFRTNYQSMLIQ